MKILLTLLVTIGIYVNAGTVETNLAAFSNAIVYNANFAEVERVVEVNSSLAANEYHSIVVKGFIQNVREETIRIISSVDVEVLDFKLSTSVIVKESTAEHKDRLAELNKKLSELQRNITVFNYEKQVLDNRMRFLNDYTIKLTHQFHTIDHLNEISIGLNDVSIGIENLKETRRCFTAIAELLVKIEETQAAYNIVRDTIAKMDRYNYNHNQATPFDKTDKELTFRIRASREVSVAAPLQFRIAYMSTTASWSSEYDIRIESNTASTCETTNSTNCSAGTAAYRMEIDCFANVLQNTGEHWIETPITLSTATPQYLQSHQAAHSTSVRFETPQLPTTRPTSQPTSVQPSVQPSQRPSGQPSAQPSAEPSSQPSSQPIVPSAMPNSQPSSAPMHSSASASMNQAQSVGTGDLAASHMFKVQYPVNVPSIDLLRAEQQTASNFNSALQSYKHLILVERVAVDCQVFTFAVPSSDARGFMMGWGTHSDSASDAKKAVTVRSPLLASNQARLGVQGANLGTVSFSAVMPGERIKLNLGFNKQIHISTSAVVPTHKGKEEDKSTWLVTDKKKFRVRTDERITTIRSSHATKEVLVIISENLPRSVEEDGVKIELLSPMPSQLIVLGAVYDTNDECIAAVLEKESPKKDGGDSRVYFNKASGNLYWAQWVSPGESVVLQYKYKMTWPDEKNVVINA